MTDRPPIHQNVIGMQRAMALKVMGERARELLAEGYAVDADRVLDEMIDRRRQWQEDAQG